MTSRSFLERAANVWLKLVLVAAALYGLWFYVDCWKKSSEQTIVATIWAVAGTFTIAAVVYLVETYTDRLID